MRFVNRVQELNDLHALEALAKKKLFVVALFGLRRVGKTRLLLEFLKSKGIYFFVNRNKTSADLLNEFQTILKANHVLGELESVATWDAFFDLLMKRDTPAIVFDEFQNFTFVEPSVFGIMQKNIDLHENKPGLFFLSGSLIGLMKNLFQNSKEPLYGRIKKGIKLEPLSLESCRAFASELGLTTEDWLKIYFIFGGYPRYFVAIEDFGLHGKKAEEIIEALLLVKDAPLEEEVNSILSQEFGGRSGVYYSILEAIANGNNTLSGIGSYLNTTPTSLTRQINELKDFFELIQFEKPYEGKRGIYVIRHPFIQFWFSQIYKNYSDYAARKPEFIQAFKKNSNNYYGKAFESAAREFLIKKIGLVIAQRQWGKIADAPKGENAYEIDLIGKSKKETVAFEFKWSKLNQKETMAVLKGLESKIKYVKNISPKTKFGVVAKKIDEKQKIRNLGYLVYDLEDF